MTQCWPSRFLTLFLVLLSVARCATTPSVLAPETDPKESRLILLEKRLEEQTAEIERLSSALEFVRRQAQRPMNNAARPRESVVPVKPVEREPVKEAPPVVSESSSEDGETLVDSRHEAMRPYFEALNAIEAGALDRAAEQLTLFVKANPDHVYADRAQALLANVYFRNQDYSLSILASHHLETKYPFSTRLPRVLFERALAYSQMKQYEPARGILREVMGRYPRTVLAREAASQLARIQ